MGIKQCIKNILSFGASNEAVDADDVIGRVTLHQTTYYPEVKPVISELAQQLAEAIRTGKIVLEVEEQLMSSIRYKEINGVTFVRNTTGIDCNGAFNPHEQRHLLSAHIDWREEQKQCKRIETRKQLKNLLSSLDK